MIASKEFGRSMATEVSTASNQVTAGVLEDIISSAFALILEADV